MSVAGIEEIENVIVSEPHAEALASMVEHATALAIWRRQLGRELKDAARLISAHAFEFAIALNPFCEAERRGVIQQLSASTGLDSTAIVDDLLDLSRRFAAAAETQTVCIRLETVRDRGCRLFHLDNVFMRLVVTYRGPGTQWVQPAFAAAARHQQTAYKGPLNSLGTGDAAIFRGKKSGGANLIYHRSPPRKRGDPPRLVAVIESGDP